MGHGALHVGAAGARRADAAGAVDAPAGGQGVRNPARGPGGDLAMKRLAVPLLAAGVVGLVALAVAVAAAPDPPEIGPALPRPPGPAEASSERGGGGGPPPSQNEFAFDFYRAATAGGERGGGNTLFSPLSIRGAFSILHEGAGGRTALQIADALGTSTDPDIRKDEARRVADALAGRGGGPAAAAIANALWIDDGFSLYDSYREVVRNAYGASAGKVDFGDAGGAVQQINGWASDSTSGLIREVIDEDGVDDSTAMVITSAVYFKGEWATPFPTNATREGPFAREDGSSTRADFMTVEGDFDHVAYDGYQVLRIPYRGDRLSMLVVLPDDAGGLGRVADGLSAGALASWLDDMEGQRWRVTIPKFTAEARHDLERAMGSMGVTDAFDVSTADLSHIGFHRDGGALYVGSAVHAAYVGVDEAGTEAAAVTSVEVRRISSTPSFVADRPFAFLIHDGESGAILFMGSVADPSTLNPQ